METKYIFLLLVLGVLILDVIIKISRYSFKARKEGIKTKGVIVGYHINGNLYEAIVKLNYNGEEIYAQTKLPVFTPFGLYEPNKEVNVEYYHSDEELISNVKMLTKVSLIKKGSRLNPEEVKVNLKDRLNIRDFRNYLDIIIGCLVLLIAGLIVL